MPTGFPRWQFRSGSRSRCSQSGWNHRRRPVRARRRQPDARPRTDWLGLQTLGPVARPLRTGPRFLRLQRRRSPRGQRGRRPRDRGTPLRQRGRRCDLGSALRSGSDQFVVRIPVGEARSIELLRNDRRKPLANCRNPFEDNGLWPRTIDSWKRPSSIGACRSRSMGSCSLIRSITTTPARRALASESPVALGVRGGALEVTDLRIYRDIYYTSALANTPRHSHGMSTAVKLGPDEYFVLGDNSPVSNDSRFWNEGPVVRGSMFVGRPFLVHLPGPGCPAQGLRAVRVLGSRSAANPLHSVAEVVYARRGSRRNRVERPRRVRDYMVKIGSRSFELAA